VDDAQIDRDRHDVEAERRAGFEPFRHGRQRGGPTPPAGAAVVFHARDDGMDLRQFELVVAGIECVVIVVKGGVAATTAYRLGGHDLVGVATERASAAFAPDAALAGTFGWGLSGRFGFWPFDGGRLELSGVFGGDSRSPSRFSSSAMRAKASRNCAACARMSASFSAAESLAGSGAVGLTRTSEPSRP